MAVEGMRFMPGERLLRTADLSSVWLVAEVFEQDLASVREGQPARITVNAYPGAEFKGTVEFIYPTVSRETRTARVRVVVPNPDGRLRADMYASIELSAGIGAGPVLVVPDSAVIDSGSRQVVLVERGEGRFEPREVKIGAAGDGFYEIRDGLKADDRVVVSANFLLDAESNLRAALRSFTAPEGKEAPK
jgi:Cu(I)/Ag(I) efflux system membrane fusion protein